MTGELAKPHCADFTTKKPESIGPRSFFQRSRPSCALKQNNPSELKIATMLEPSVAGVELQCVALGCRFTVGTAVCATTFQTIRPVAASSESKRHVCGQPSWTGSMLP